MKYQKIFVIFWLNFAILFANQNAFANHSEIRTSRFFSPDKFLRTELYFGTDSAGGGTVSEEDWNKFLEAEVTPRFPKGFTVLDGFGQFRGNNGKIVREKSHVLIVLYPKNTRKENHAKIEQIRAAYAKMFQQESVLRMDFVKSVNVKF